MDDFVREDDEGDDTAFEDRMAAAEAVAVDARAHAAWAAQSQQLNPRSLYFDSRKAAAAALLANSAFSAGSKLFSTGSITVTVSRLVIKDVHKLSASGAAGVGWGGTLKAARLNLDINVFGKPIATSVVDLSTMEKDIDMPLRLSACFEEDPSMLPVAPAGWKCRPPRLRASATGPPVGFQG